MLKTVSPSFFGPENAVEERVARVAVALAPTPPAATGFHVLQHSLDAQLALSLKVPGVSSGELKGKSAVLLYEFLIDSKETATVQPDGEVFVQRYSGGLQVVVIIREITASFSLNLYAVAVASKLGLAKSLLKVRFKGLPGGAGPLGNIPKPGTLNTAGGLNSVISYIKEVKDYVAANPAQVKLEPDTIVLGRKAADEDAEAQATVFALRQIQKGRAMLEAVGEASRLDMDPDIIKAIYRGYLDDLTENPKPEKKHKSAAKRWLAV